MILLIQIAALASAASPLAAPATGMLTAATAVQAPPMVGGYRAVSVEDETVQHLAAFVSEQTETEFVEIVSAHRQTVQGANYRLVLLDAEGNSWQFTVYQNLQGELQITSSQQI
jgi:hypothetical protein